MYFRLIIKYHLLLRFFAVTHVAVLLWVRPRLLACLRLVCFWLLDIIKECCYSTVS